MNLLNNIFILMLINLNFVKAGALPESFASLSEYQIVSKKEVDCKIQNELVVWIVDYKILSFDAHKEVSLLIRAGNCYDGLAQFYKLDSDRTKALFFASKNSSHFSKIDIDLVNPYEIKITKRITHNVNLNGLNFGIRPAFSEDISKIADRLHDQYSKKYPTVDKIDLRNSIYAQIQNFEFYFKIKKK